MVAALMGCAVEGVGVNWGTMASHPLPPDIVVQMLKDNGINTVKLFDADGSTLKALAGTDIEVMVAIPNNMLQHLCDSYKAAKKWVKENVTRYNFDGGNSWPNRKLSVDGNVSLADKIKTTVPLNADVYNSPADNQVPSAGDFREDIRDLMVQLVKFLNDNGGPFTVNIYPFLSLYADEGFPVNFAFFDGDSTPVVDGKIQYTNVFDANFDTLVASLNKAGVPNMSILVGEVGWPTNGNTRATIDLCPQRFYQGLMKKLINGQGTPLRPGNFSVYLFSLLDEDVKSVAPGNFERHWGIFQYDGQPKYEMDLPGQNGGLVPAKNVQYMPQKWCVFNSNSTNTSTLIESITYACERADCTALGYGSSCNNLDMEGNASYAFNMYFQVNDQYTINCIFDGLATITEQNASSGSCNFPIQILNGAAERSFMAHTDWAMVLMGVVVLLSLF
ncbi:hypothetical protein KI387_003236 [Taxus chinensis]|uniref:X8 domain-containing protein n=1 Tax=Taxus chinensis TaxID=29808 RepID=A0AA38LMX6_TAXCH|nr:hypothetical protein KI387_003236 [Taxus chinensis]